MHSFAYVDPPNQNLLCCICRAPFVDPVTTRSCSHTFCRSCCLEALQHARQCPVDRSPLSAQDLVPANPIIRALVDELIVECIHPECSHTTQRQLLTAHLLDSCPFSLVSCPNNKCDQTLPRKDAATHDCTKKLVSCDLCDAEIPLDDLENHVAGCQESTTTCDACSASLSRSAKASHVADCPGTIVVCTQAPNGCPWIGPRSSLSSEHIPTCPYAALAGFFALHRTEQAQLAQENNILRHKIAALEDTLFSQRRELQSVKDALGPWYRPDGPGFPGIGLGIATDDLPSDERQQLSSGFGDAAPPDDLAAYFPSEAAAATPSNRATESQQQHLRPAVVSLGASAGTPGAGIARQYIAPLNLSTSLEGTLVGMRESVVSLGSALDSFGRRADIALSNETMRLNEEIMSLRASMHGLRMQVHTIMMDMNSQVTGRNPEMLQRQQHLHSASASIANDGGSWPPPSMPRFFFPAQPTPGTKL
uniref:TRAF-type zinc finger protein n=1 Tax=Mycena chlorophos TaxID=658473 RepID=A0ABQ0LZ19_MYCCL|nr:TRAF-type zinc finger protein [Mycena chlorophos]